MQAIRTYKMFHILMDSISGVPEKAFILKDSLSQFESGLPPELEMIGMAGPESSVKQTIHRLRKALGIVEETEQLGESSRIDLSLAREEEAAIYLIRLASSRQKGRHYCVAVLSVPDKFYYEKPFDKKSFLYLLARFIGDMCPTIALVYDKTIEENFQSQGCPLFEEATPIDQFQVAKQTKANITIEYRPADLQLLLQFDQHYDRRMNFQNPNRSSLLVHTNFLQANSFEQRFSEDLSKLVEKFWRTVFIESEKNPEEVLDKINSDQPTGKRQLADRIIELERRLYDNIEIQLKDALRKVPRSRWESFRARFVPNEQYVAFTYKVFIRSVVLQPNTMSFRHASLGQLQSRIIIQLAQEIDKSKKPSDHDEEQFQETVRTLISSVDEFLQKTVNELYQSVGQTLRKERVVGQQELKVSLFRLNVVNDQEGKAVRVALSQTQHILFRESIEKQRLGIDKLEDIKVVNVFELSGKSHSKLVWLQLTNTAILLISIRGYIRMLTKYLHPKLQFFYSTENRKGYLLNADNMQITQFNINELEKITEEVSSFYSRDYRQIVSFGISGSVESVEKEQLFYLTKQGNVLYRYSLCGRKELKICNQLKEGEQSIRYFLSTRESPYEFVKCFNKDYYVALGNKQRLDIVEWDANGKPSFKYSLNLEATFLGVNTFLDDQNEYLLLHDQQKPSVLVLNKMNLQATLKNEQTKMKNLKKGNPIIDVFVQANLKFGPYTDGELTQNISLVHLTDLNQREIKKYLEELPLANHDSSYLPIREAHEILTKTKSTAGKTLLEIIQTRIPIHVCTINNGNLELLSAGVRRHNHVTNQQVSRSVLQRQNRIDLGIVEDIMISDEDKDKGVIVVSVMGPQSIGKSYLMNRLFGTRFAVASSRTTDGLWISLSKSKDVNFLVIDSEGLFSLTRSSSEEQKLIRVLASISDYTILNQNRGTNDRHTSSLLQSISASLNRTSGSANGLYTGKLFVVVRDVSYSESDTIKEEFKRSFETGEGSELRNNFVRQLFNSSINILPINSFETTDRFKKDISTIRNHFEVEGRPKQCRKPREILNKFKTVLAQIVCDDSRAYAQTEELVRFDNVRRDVMELWSKGNQDKSFSRQIGQKQMIILDQEVTLYNNNDSQEKDRQAKHPEIFQRRLRDNICLEELPTTEFDKVFRGLNDYIVEFFQQRRDDVKKVLLEKVENELSSVEQSKRSSFVDELLKAIDDQKERLRLCLNKCSKCRLVCVSWSGHQSNIESEKRKIKDEIASTEKELKELSALLKSAALTEEDVRKKKAAYGESITSLEQAQTQAIQQADYAKKMEVVSRELNISRKEIEEIHICQSSRYLHNLELELDRVLRNVEEYEEIVKRSRGDLPGLNSTLQIDIARLKDLWDSEQQAAEFQESIGSSLTKLTETLIQTRSKMQGSSSDMALLEQSIENERQVLKQIQDIIENSRKQIDQYSSDVQLTKSECGKLQSDVDTLNSTLRQLETQGEGVPAQLNLIKKAESNLRTTKEAPSLQTLEKKVSELTKALSLERFQPSFQSMFEARLTSLASIEKKLNKFRASEQERENERKFEEYILKLSARLSTSTQKQTAQTASSLIQPKLDCREILQSRLNLWTKKIAANPTSERLGMFKQKQQQAQMLIEEYEIESSRIVKYEQSEEEIALRTAKKKLLQELHVEFGGNYLSVSEVIVEYLSSSTVANKYGPIAQEELLQEFIQKYPRYSELANLSNLSAVCASDRESLSQQIESITSEKEKCKRIYDETEDQKVLTETENKLSKLQKELEIATLRFDFACFQTQSQSKQRRSQQKSVFETAREEAKIEGIQRSLSSLQQTLTQLKKKQVAARQESDDTEDDQRYSQLEQELKWLEAGQEKLTSEMEIAKSYEENVKRLIDANLKAFLDKAEQPNVISGDIDIELDVETNRFMLIQRVDGTELKELSSGLLSFMEGKPLHTKEKQDPLFKAVVDIYPGDQCQSIVKELQNMLKHLTGIGSPLAKNLCERIEAIVVTGKIEDLPQQLMKSISEDMLSGIERDRAQLKREVQDQQGLVKREKDALAQEQERLRKLLELQKQEKTIEQKRTAKRKAQEQFSELSIKLIQLQRKMMEESGNLRRKESELERATENYEGLKAQLERSRNIIQLLSTDTEPLNILLKRFWEEHRAKCSAKQRKRLLTKKISDLEKSMLELRNTQENHPVCVQGRTLERIEKELKDLRGKQDHLNTIQQNFARQKVLREEINRRRIEKENLEKKEDEQCYCSTDHRCNRFCDAGCKDHRCQHPAGHNGTHLCLESNHTCKQTCQAQQDCKSKCTLSYQHSAEVKHNCQEEHRCQKRCKYCKNMCQKSASDKHQLHECLRVKKCIEKCILCSQQCASQHHNHDDEAELVTVRNKDREKKEGYAFPPDKISRKLHLCANQHQCEQECGSTGVCEFSYRSITKIWRRSESEQPYEYMEQVSIRKKCMMKVPAKAIRHEGECNCSQSHTCTVRCPDCKSLCELKLNHKGKHNTRHRNQESLMHVAESRDATVRIENRGKEYLFSVGDESTPTNCYEGCVIKGRGHYHLKECKGGAQCGEKIFKQANTVLHSDKVYHPHTEKQYDRYLCEEYWNANNFEMPNPQYKQEYSRCNFICTMQHKDQTKKSFCGLTAWHSFDSSRQTHQFDCDVEHRNQRDKKIECLQICFLIDVTGSMSKWVDECKNTVKQIVQSTKSKYPDLKVNFAVVGYRDHPMCLSPLVKQLKQLTDDKLRQLQRVSESNPHGKLIRSQKEYINMLLILQQQWKSKREDMQSFRNGLSDLDRFVLSYHYPFVLDINTKEEIVDVYYMKKLYNPKRMVMELMIRMAAATQGIQIELPEEEENVVPLRTHLINNLKRAQKDLEEHLSKREELLAFLEFSTDQKVIEFLDSPAMESDGGGDPSEAVLDGMNKVADLNWMEDNKSLKYVFHLFDAPPHGAKYREGGDFFPEGCPCKLQEREVIRRLHNLQVNYVVFPLSQSVNKAVEIFQRQGLKITIQEAEKPEEITVNTVGVLARELEQQDLSVPV